jgi:hypothetical protein
VGNLQQVVGGGGEEYAVMRNGAALGEANLTLKEVWHDIRHRPAEETGVYYEGKSVWWITGSGFGRRAK